MHAAPIARTYAVGVTKVRLHGKDLAGCHSAIKNNGRGDGPVGWTCKEAGYQGNEQPARPCEVTAGGR